MSSKFLPVHYFLRIVVATPAQPARFTFARCFDSKTVQLGVCGTVSPWQKLWAAASRENDLKVAAPNSSRQTLAMPRFSEWSVWLCTEWCFLFRGKTGSKKTCWKALRSTWRKKGTMAFTLLYLSKRRLPGTRLSKYKTGLAPKDLRLPVGRVRAPTVRTSTGFHSGWM